MPIRPDAFFSLELTDVPAPQNKARFFLEADRSTTSNKRFQEKIIGFWRYFETGGHTEKYKIKSFRVLTVTLTEERAVNLCRAAREVLPTSACKYYQFASLGKAPLGEPSFMSEERFFNPRDVEERVKHPLIVRPATFTALAGEPK